MFRVCYCRTALNEHFSGSVNQLFVGIKVVLSFHEKDTFLDEDLHVKWI